MARIPAATLHQAFQPAYLAKKGMARRNISRCKRDFNTRQVSKSAIKSIGRSISPPRINPFHEQPPRSAPHVLRDHRTHRNPRRRRDRYR
ncbi:hypothetical protein DIE03_17710 [Burkholderia sp. Bp8992]|nr:hypothetical protein DIE03_17710 [Burkholderia sp. Bp8992]